MKELLFKLFEKNQMHCEQCGKTGLARQMTVSNSSEEVVLCDHHWNEFCKKERAALRRHFDGVERRFYSA